MATQKVTLSLNPETYQKFQELKTIQGLSISGWVTAKMQKEIDKQDELKIVCKILRKEYPNLTDGVSDKQILNDIVTILMSREMAQQAYCALYHALDNL